MEIRLLAGEDWPAVESLLLIFPSSDYREYLAGLGYRLYLAAQVRRLAKDGSTAIPYGFCAAGNCTGPPPWCRSA